jgi:Ca2+-dependent lipid-binding protein
MKFRSILHVVRSCSEKSKRRTKTVAGTLEPKWNQTFIYSPMKRSDLENSSLEITVYDYDRIGSGEYVGEVRIQISVMMRILQGRFVG